MNNKITTFLFFLFFFLIISTINIGIIAENDENNVISLNKEDYKTKEIVDINVKIPFNITKDLTLLLEVDNPENELLLHQVIKVYKSNNSAKFSFKIPRNFEKGKYSIYVSGIYNDTPFFYSKTFSIMEEEKEPFIIPQIVIIVVIIILGATTASFFAGTEIGKWKFLTLIFIPLYNRLHKDEVLDHKTRGMILGFVTANPGSNFNLIKNSLRLKNGTLAHHLNILEKTGFVKFVNKGANKLVYPTGVRGPNATRILNLIIGNPGITQKEISQETKIKQQTVNRNVKIMVEEGIIRKEKKDGKKRLYFVEIEKTTFNNCPFCGKKFELPETPNFCPYCNERLK